MTKKTTKPKYTLGAGLQHDAKALTAPPKKKMGRPRTGNVKHDPAWSPFTLYLEVATKREAKIEAERVGRSLSKVANELLKTWTDDQRRRSKSA
jgi:hypothetical protein